MALIEITLLINAKTIIVETAIMPLALILTLRIETMLDNNITNRILINAKNLRLYR